MRATRCAAKASSLTRNVDRRGGADAGAKNSRGCGSNVSTAGSRFRSSAASVRRVSIAWWPRWTPSKLPMVSATRASASAGRPRKTRTVEPVPSESSKNQTFYRNQPGSARGGELLRGLARRRLVARGDSCCAAVHGQRTRPRGERLGAGALRGLGRTLHEHRGAGRRHLGLALRLPLPAPVVVAHRRPYAFDGVRLRVARIELRRIATAQPPLQAARIGGTRALTVVELTAQALGHGCRAP